jgi:hypothetical protein
MRNTIRIPKNHTWLAGSLVCENLIVNGELTITGELTARRVTGRGAIDAGTITAETVRCENVRADALNARRLCSKNVTAGVMRLGNEFKSAYAENAAESAGSFEYAPEYERRRTDGEAESEYAQNAESVTEFFDIDTEELNGSGGEPDTADCGETAEAHYDANEYNKVVETRDKTDADVGKSGTDSETSVINYDRLLDDPAFLRLRALYAMEREYGGTWRLEPNLVPTDTPYTEYISPAATAA